MNEASLSEETDRAAIAALFTDRSPVLVEVRFPHAGTSPDWYLYEDQEDLARLLERLAPGTEVHLSSVWDLKSSKEEICFRK